MTLIENDMRRALASTLTRKASTTCSAWAQNYVILGKPVPGPLSFRRFPWSKKWHDDPRSWAGMKAAQMAMTQAALHRAIWTIDIRGNNVLYLLPKRTPDAADFSKTKFDPLLDLSPHLSELFSRTRNTGLKQAGAKSLYIRGGRSKSGLKSISTGEIIYDELDEFPQKNIALADERASGYDEADRHEIKISTPTIPDFGIHAVYKDGTQEHFQFKCLSCNKWTELLGDCTLTGLLKNLVITAEDYRSKDLRKSYIKTSCCGATIPHEAKPEWFASGMWVSSANKDAPVGSYWIPKLYSTTEEPWRIAKSVLKAAIDPAEEQELWNSKMGLPHEVEGARVKDEQINACQKGYYQPPHAQYRPPPRVGIFTLGIDVGNALHYEVNQWFLPERIGKDLNVHAVPKVLAQGTLLGTNKFERLDDLMYEWNITHAVIDAMPQDQMSYEFTMRFAGRANMAYPHRGLSERQLTIKQENNAVGFRRTNWLDISQGRFRTGRIHLPNNISEEYREAIKALVRIERKNDDGDLVAKYISTKADHEAFARMYNEIALVFAVSGRENTNVDMYL